MVRRSFLPGWLALALSLALAGQGTAPALRIVVVQGEGAINNISDRSTRDLIVRVERDGGAPVEGAAVSFTVPNLGPTGTFNDGLTSVMATTGADGRAVARRLRPNNVVGNWTVRVTASFGGATAKSEIAQTNALGGPVARKKGRSKPLIITGVVAAAAAGALLGTRGGSSSTSRPPAAAPGTVVIPEAPSVGGPN